MHLTAAVHDLPVQICERVTFTSNEGSFPTLYLLSPNKANSQHSTGPRTEEGKAKSSLNAVKTGLTGRTVLLPGDDIAAYRQHVAALEAHHSPATDAEKLLVQSIADTEWRAARIPSLEAGIYALGRLEFAALFEHEDPAVRPALLEAKTFLVYQKQLNNLSVQENRLRRQREKDIAELQQLQADREAARKKRFDTGLNAYYRAMFHQRAFDFSTIGFEFTAEQFLTEIATWGPYGRNKLNTLVEEEDRLFAAFPPSAHTKAA
jgi:hypothetical protein